MTDMLLFQLSLSAIIGGWLLLLAGYLLQQNGRVTILVDLAGLWFPAVLCVLHAVLLGMSLMETPEQGSLFSLTGIITKFADRERLFLLYLEGLIFSLFVGRWIADDAASRKVPMWLTVPVLMLQCGLGPPALGLWLALRSRWKQQEHCPTQARQGERTARPRPRT